MSYANGPGFEDHKSENCSENYWRTFTDEERHDPEYRQFSGVRVSKETHAGEDVPVYSRGPQANLLAGVFEQNYIAHAICYIACIGPHATYCNYAKRSEILPHEHSSSATSNSCDAFYNLIPTFLLLIYKLYTIKSSDS